VSTVQAFKPVDAAYGSHDHAPGGYLDSATWTPGDTLAHGAPDGLLVYNSFGWVYVWGNRNIGLGDASRALEVSFDSGDLIATLTHWAVNVDVYDQVDPSLPAPTDAGIVTYRVSSVTVLGEWTHEPSPAGWTFTGP
jgi:hypothetical protein